MRTSVFLVLLVAAGAAACGGSQEPAEARPEPTPATTQVEPTRPPPEAEHVYYQVFWRELHVMTIYATGGPLRSEEPENPDEVFSGRSPFMSVVSHYYEQEPVMRRLIDRAQSLEDFLSILAEEDYEIREEVFEDGY
jgi:hypothetical protein